MDNKFAQKFGQEWVASWNSHDLNEIFSHYTNDFEMISPVIKQLANEPGGTLKGKATIRAYWSSALERYPDLHFEFQTAFVGVDSVVVFYKGHRGLSAEVFFFDDNGKVTKAYAHYE